MLSLQSDSFSWSMDGQGLSLAIRTPKAKEICEKVKQGKQYTVEIKEYRPRRSETANNYLWFILDKCAAKLGTTKEELYISYIRKVGMFKDFVLTENEAKTFSVAWGKMGIGWPTEIVDFDGDKRIVRAYYGSSTYNSKQMSRLIDMVVEDAKEIGIDVLSERDRSLLIEKWIPVVY